MQIKEQTLESGRKLPALKMLSSDVKIPKENIKLDLFGGIVFDSINLFKPIFMGMIREEIIKEVNSALLDQIPTMLDAKIAESKGETELYTNMDLDWSIQQTPNITPELLNLSIKGLFFPKDKGEVDTITGPPVMPMHKLTEKAKL